MKLLRTVLLQFLWALIVQLMFSAPLISWTIFYLVRYSYSHYAFLLLIACIALVVFGILHSVPDFSKRSLVHMKKHQGAFFPSPQTFVLAMNVFLYSDDCYENDTNCYLQVLHSFYVRHTIWAKYRGNGYFFKQCHLYWAIGWPMSFGSDFDVLLTTWMKSVSCYIETKSLIFNLPLNCGFHQGSPASRRP